MESTFAATSCCTRRVKAFSSTPCSSIGVLGNTLRPVNIVITPCSGLSTIWPQDQSVSIRCWTPGIICCNPSISLSPASVKAPSGITGKLSKMNHMLFASASRRVLTPCRQFQRRQVTPLSSRQTTSPGSGYSKAGAPSFMVSKGSVPSATTSRGEPTYASMFSRPTGMAHSILIAL